MLFESYKNLCGNALGIRSEDVIISDSGRITVNGGLSTLDRKGEAVLKILQSRLTEEMSLIEELETAKSKVQALSQSLSSREELFNDFGHELRSPLSAVLNLSQILSEAPLPKDSSKIVTTLCHSAHQVSRLVEDALCLRNIERGSIKINSSVVRTQTFLSALTEQMISTQTFSGGKVTAKIGEGFPEEFRIDLDKLEQIVLALIYCIFRKLPEGAERIETSFNWEESGLSFTAYAPKLVLPKSERAILLRGWPELVTDGPENFGVSMAVANSLIRVMGGTIDVSEVPMSGTLFKVRLPAQAESENKTPDQPSSGKSKEDHWILAVDDDPTSLLVLKYVVKKLGYRMKTAETGTTALRELASGNYSLVILDLRMPGMSGLQVAQIIRDELKLEMPIIAMSGDTTTLAREEAYRVGMSDFLPKPLRRERLSQILQEFL